MNGDAYLSNDKRAHDEIRRLRRVWRSTKRRGRQYYWDARVGEDRLVFIMDEAAQW